MKSAQSHLRNSYPGMALGSMLRVSMLCVSMCMCCMKTRPVAGAPEAPL